MTAKRVYFFTYGVDAMGKKHFWGEPHSDESLAQLAIEARKKSKYNNPSFVRHGIYFEETQEPQKTFRRLTFEGK